MKRLGLLCASAILFTLASARAGNLFTNGDFSEASLQPWASTGGAVLSGGKASLNNGSIQQVISTKAGAEYYLVLSATSTAITPGSVVSPSLSIFAGSQGGMAADFQTTIQVGPSFPVGLPVAPRYVFRFTASGTNTIVTISGTSIVDPIFPGSSVSPAVDDLAIYELARSRYAGKYNGTLVTTTKITDPALAQSNSSRVNAQVTAEGRIYLLLAGGLGTGVVQNDGTVDFYLPAYGRISGQAKVRAGKIEVLLPAVQLSLLDEFGVALQTEVGTKLTLTRTGK